MYLNFNYLNRISDHLLNYEISTNKELAKTYRIILLMNKTNICCIFNLGAHYRKPIYNLMDKELQCDFFIGDGVTSPIKKFDYNELNGFKKLLHNVFYKGGFYWQNGILDALSSKYKYYIITGEPFCLSTWLVLLYARITSKKTFLWTHGWYGREKGLKKFIKRVFFGLSKYVFLYGDYARNLMIREGFKPSKLYCIYNSLDYDGQLIVRQKLSRTDIFTKHFGNDFPVVCYVGRIQKSKRLDMMVDAMLLLKKNYGRTVNFVVVGKESEETGLKQMVLDKSLGENVWFYGPCFDENELGNIFFNSAVCISPGNVGLTAIHALTYGCPVITHDNFSRQGPEFEAIIPGATGDFFEENNMDSLADTINEWLESHPSNNEEFRIMCHKIIDEKYNPHYQINLLKRLII